MAIMFVFLFIQKLMVMKEEIARFFKTDRSFNGAIPLIMKYSNKLSLKKQLNVQAETPHLKGVIFEELRELAGISHQEFENIIKSKIVKPVRQTEPVTDPEPVVKDLKPEKKKNRRDSRKKSAQ
jgi:hypothetical protein